MNEIKPIIVVTGANGQLGKSIRNLSSDFPDFTFLFADIEEFDITQDNALTSFLEKSGFNKKQIIERQLAIINAAAYTAVDMAEDNMTVCDEINHLAVSRMARECKTLNCLMIQVSTDYVFDGNQSIPYKEDDLANPLSVYGRSKLSAEKDLINILEKNAIVIRTSWLYSPFGNNFAKKMIDLSFKQKNINVVSDQIGTPTFAPNLAFAIITILMDGFSRGHFPFSSVHYSDAGVCSWYDFAYEAITRRGNTQCEITPVNSDDYPCKAKRPYYSVLNKDRFDNYYHLKRYHWTKGLEQVI